MPQCFETIPFTYSYEILLDSPAYHADGLKTSLA